MRTSKFVNLNENVLLEWIYDDDNLLIENYKIVSNTITEQRNFVNTAFTNNLPTTTKNLQPVNLFEVNAESNRWAPMNEDEYPFLQVSNFAGNVPMRYDIVRLHFPVNYTFDDKIGYLLNIYVLDVSGKNELYLSNFYFDLTDTQRSLDLTAPPFLYRDVLWGKFKEIQVPATNVLAKQITQGDGLSLVPTPGSINSNLAGPTSLGVANSSPIFIDFAFLLKKEILFDKLSYLIQNPFSTSIPQTPEFEDLSVSIIDADDGDYFEIFGTYSGTASEFETFIEQQASIGNVYYVTYTVTVIEKNIITDTVSYFVENNFDNPLRFRPIISFSTTTAVIDVQMKLVNATDGNFILRTASYTMLQDEVAMYSRNLTKINIENAFRAKIYNSLGDQINVQQFGDTETQVEKLDVPFPVMFDRYSIVTKNKTDDVQDETYYGIGQLQILLYPFDNIVKLVVAKDITEVGDTGEKEIVPFEIPTGTRLTLTFKSNTDTVDSELYYDSNDVDLSQGKVVFRVLQSTVATITEFFKNGYDQFYIVIRPETSIDTIIYAGRYLIYNEF